MIARKVLLEKSHLDYLEHFRRLHKLSSGNEAIRSILEQHQLYFSQTEGSVARLLRQYWKKSTVSFYAVFEHLHKAQNAIHKLCWSFSTYYFSTTLQIFPMPR